MNEKHADFERWSRDLDYHCQQRPLVGSTTKSQIIQRNLESYDRQFKGLMLCAAPDCRYPLQDDEGFYVPEVGRCCWLCHDMDSALRQTISGVAYGTIFEWFEAAHKQWKAAQARIKRIQKDDDQGGLK